METLYKHENLAFISSSFINVYPCGRRRAVSITKGAVTGSIPFDPESKLSTERNLRHLTAINGYNTTYVYEITDTAAVFVIDGYLFKINIDAFLESTDVSIQNFGNKIWNTLNSDEPDGSKYLCAKIKLREIPLVDMGNAADFVCYNTPILESQMINTEVPEEIDAGLDLNLLENNAPDHYTNYVFTGISFVTVPKTEFTPYLDKLDKHFKKDTITDEINEITLKLLQYTGHGWEVCQEALLPSILHDITENSVRITGELTADAKSHFKGYVHILNGASIDNNLAVGGNTALEGSLNVNGDSQFATATFNGTTAFKTTATFSGKVIAEQDVEINTNLQVKGQAEINNGLKLTDGGLEVQKGDLKVQQGGISVTDGTDGNIATKANVFADKSITAKSQLATHKELLVNIADGGSATFGTFTANMSGHLTKDATKAAGSISLDPADDTKVLASFNHVDADRVRTKKDGKLQEVAVIKTSHVTGDTYKLIIK